MKEKYFTYECIRPVEVIFRAADQRRERWPKGVLQPPQCEHSFRFTPEDPDSNRPADHLVTNRPIAAHFTDAITKMVNRRLSLEPGKRARRDFETTTSPKFLLLEPSEIIAHPKRRTMYLDLRECDYLPIEKKPGRKPKEPEEAAV